MNDNSRTTSDRTHADRVEAALDEIETKEDAIRLSIEAKHRYQVTQEDIDEYVTDGDNWED